MWKKINVSVTWRIKLQDPWLVEKWTLLKNIILLKIKKNYPFKHIASSPYCWGPPWLTALWFSKQYEEVSGYAKTHIEPDLKYRLQTKIFQIVLQGQDERDRGDTLGLWKAWEETTQGRSSRAGRPNPEIPSGFFLCLVLVQLWGMKADGWRPWRSEDLMKAEQCGQTLAGRGSRGKGVDRNSAGAQGGKWPPERRCLFGDSWLMSGRVLCFRKYWV